MHHTFFYDFQPKYLSTMSDANVYHITSIFGGYFWTYLKIGRH